MIKAKRVFCTRLCAMLVVTLSLYVFTKNSVAGYKDQTKSISVYIGGVDYGTFPKVIGLDEAINSSGKGFSKISLERNFVADPSLYLWAKSLGAHHGVLGDIYLVEKDSSGMELSRYTLKRCQPLSWAVEKSNPAVGGFHEVIDIAIREVEIN